MPTMKGKRNHSLKEVHVVIAVSQNNSSTNAEDGNIRRGSFLCFSLFDWVFSPLHINTSFKNSK